MTDAYLMGSRYTVSANKRFSLKFSDSAEGLTKSTGAWLNVNGYLAILLAQES